MRIETIRLKNFKAFEDIEMLDIPQLCVVVGANGTGKSTLFDVFGFLKDCLTADLLDPGSGGPVREDYAAAARLRAPFRR